MPRLLIVDDDPGIVALLKQALEAEGHEIQTAENGVRALERQRETPSDLMIVDILMPEKDGLETIRDIRKLTPGIRILAMSGGGRVSPENYLPIAQMLGADETLAKPFSLVELRAAVKRLLPAD
jgi:DNA-binding response OmpR family regulator